MRRKKNDNEIAGIAFCQTKYGIFIAHFSLNGLFELLFPEKKTEHIVIEHPKVYVSSEIPDDRATLIFEWARLTNIFLTDYFDRKKPVFLAPLDLSEGTDFQRLVWGELKKIKWGETKTYGELARKIGYTNAARAVGLACGANPVPIIIPCHRVVGVNGQLGGFSAGLRWKKLLLKIENALV
ncbi:MAG: methylated-DNA--[protein]-cysteine S-methyltransferase [Verrucomicrobiia bacterium]